MCHYFDISCDSHLVESLLTFYGRLFEWLVTFINNSICADKSTWTNFIGEHFSASVLSLLSAASCCAPCAHGCRLVPLQESWTCTASSASTLIIWSSCASTTQTKNCSSTLWLIICALSRSETISVLIFLSRCGQTVAREPYVACKTF